jgi:hypothetical protein
MHERLFTTQLKAAPRRAADSPRLPAVSVENAYRASTQAPLGGAGWDFRKISIAPSASPAPAGSGLLLQPKLRIGATDDPLESEADHVADEVLRQPDSDGVLRRKCSACEAEEESEAPQGPSVQRRASRAVETVTAPPAVYNVLRSHGRPLDPAVRSDFEGRFGHSFANVRVHDDGEAARSASAVGAWAYTVGSDIAFAAGSYNPGSAEGRRLLAHELTHVLQQRSAGALLQRDGKPDAQPRVDVAVLLNDDEQSKAAGSALASGLTIRVFDPDDLRAKLQAIGKPIGKLYVVSHANSQKVIFTGKEGSILSVTLSELAAKLKGVLPAGQAPQVIDFRGCQVGENPEGMDKVRKAVGASAASGTNCYTKDTVMGPFKLSLDNLTFHDITSVQEAAPYTKQNVNKALRQLISDLKTEGGTPVKDCIVGLAKGEKADTNFEKIKSIYFKNKGRLVAGWVSPESDERWHLGSKCFKDLTSDENQPCYLTTTKTAAKECQTGAGTRFAQAESAKSADPGAESPKQEA